MRKVKLSISLLAVGFIAVAQTDRGTITGTVSDPTGAVVASAAIEAKNVATGATYTATSTQTGNYTLPQLPAGSYEVTVNVQGFKKYTRQGLALAPTQVMRIDVALEVGSSAESVTITAEATLMKTESSEVSQTVTGDRINNLPLLSIGEQQASAAGVRNPWALATLVPGIQYVVGGFFGGTPNIVANGAAANTASYRIEGMDAGNNGTLNVFTMEVQPSAEAIQEVAVQTSNFAAEYGAVGGGLFNASMRSGTNQYHGSLYDYNVNEAYNASQPYTGLHNKARRNDYGGSLGGPVRIPKIYNGTNKTFFFWNFEQYRERQTVSTTTVTVPITDYRNGDFSKVISASGNQTINVSGAPYKDPLGRTIQAGQIFDPQSFSIVTLASGATQVVRNPFPGNKIDPTRFDTVAKNIQNLIPPPTGPNAGLIGNNFNNAQNSERTTEIPSLKLDQTVGSKGHLSFYWSGTRTADQYPIVGSPAQPEGFPPALSTVIGNFDRSHTERLNYDHTLSPTLLLHIGLGYQKNHLFDDTPVTNFDAFKELGLKGQTVIRQFPTVSIGAAANTGGMSNMGPLFQTHQFVEKPAVNLSMTWVKSNHSYKIGAEWRIEGNPQVSNAQPPWTTAGAFDQVPTFPALSTATTQTSLEGLGTTGGTVGFGYASFLLGQVTGYGVGVPSVYHIGRQQWGMFAQDTWKVTRKLTLDYGIRWDYGTYSVETYGRQPSFAPLLPNPTADNHPGALQYEATCHCKFANNYPYAIGPRIGVAYQINSKTVIRGGFGVVYNTSSTGAFSPPLNYQLAGVPAFGQSLFQMQNGPPAGINPSIVLTPGGLPSLKGTVTGGPLFVDPNAARPARQYQWSIGLQREVTRNLVVEASYVANRGIWWSAGALAPINSMSQGQLTKDGFTVGTLADGTALSTPLGPQLAGLASRGVGLPYASFPVAQTVLQSLLPFPQFTGNINPTAAPLGKTWYDSLQVTLTQRLSHGLTVNGNFTWSKNLDLLSSPDIFNRSLGKNISVNDLPLQLRFSAQYVTPRVKVFGSGLASYLLGDWTVGWYAQYQSAPIIARPASAGLNGIQKWLGRGPGPAEYVASQPLFSNNWVDYDGKVHTDPIDLNCHCFDPTKNIVLNPAAWANVPDGQWSSNQSSFRNYRGFRYPTENANFGRTFRIKEKVTFNVRVEFSNAFNRTRLPQPNAGTIPGQGFATKPSPQTTGPYIGLWASGFGTVVPTTGTQGYRTGTLVGRITF
ncbi:MAG: TonB-dependent receptor [Acidobacteriia bacterium]|nr:TonB-dependent receptor [Terriglobia bacterium]